MDINEDLKLLTDEASAALRGAKNHQELQNIKAQYLGKKGKIGEYMNHIRGAAEQPAPRVRRARQSCQNATRR